MRRAEEGSTQVLEAIILALVLLGAAWSVTSLSPEGQPSPRPRASLEQISRDALVVLAGIDGEGNPLLEEAVTEALHCMRDEVPSTLSCDGERGRNLSLKLQYYLPSGAGYAVQLHNGLEARDAYRSTLPAGERVSSSLAIVPRWNTSFVVPELSCYEPGMDANVTLVPLRNGVRTPAASARLDWGAHSVAAEKAWLPGAWNATVPAALFPATATPALANVTHREVAYHGASTLAPCDLGGLGGALVAALRDVTFTASSGVVTPDGTVALEADLSSLLSLAGVAVYSAEAVVHEPLPARGREPDTHVVAARLVMPVGSSAQAEWSPGTQTLYGAHVAVLKVTVGTPGDLVELRRVVLVDVGLRSGHVPVDAPYRVVLQAWMPDWT